MTTQGQFVNINPFLLAQLVSIPQVDVQRAGVANEDTIAMIRKEKESVEKELGMIRDALAG